MPAFIGKRLPVFFYLLKIILPMIRNPSFIKEIMVGEIRRILTQKKACLRKPLLLVGRVRIELTANGLKVRCSTSELTTRSW